MKLCPEDGAFLSRYRVGTGDSITIDRCAACSGIWLDANEWDILGEHDLHEHLYDVLDPEWQDELRDAELSQVEHGSYLRQLGTDDLQRLQEVRDWLDSHPQKSELYAYLWYSSRS